MKGRNTGNSSKLVYVLCLPIATEAQCHSATVRSVRNRERKTRWGGRDLKGRVKREKRKDDGGHVT